MHNRLDAKTRDATWSSQIESLFRPLVARVREVVGRSPDRNGAALETASVRCLDAIRSPAPAGILPASFLPSGLSAEEGTCLQAPPGTEIDDFVERLVTRTGAQVLRTEKDLRPEGRRGAAAFELALLVTLHWQLEKNSDADLEVEWESGLPASRVALPDGRSLLMIAARPNPEHPGHGLAVGVLNRSATSAEAVFSLVLPVTTREDAAGPTALRILEIRLPVGF